MTVPCYSLDWQGEVRYTGPTLIQQGASPVPLTQANPPVDITSFLPGGAFVQVPSRVVDANGNLVSTTVNARVIPVPMPTSVATVWLPTFDTVTYSFGPTSVGFVILRGWDTTGQELNDFQTDITAEGGIPGPLLWSTGWQTVFTPPLAFWRAEVDQNDFRLVPREGPAQLHADFYCPNPLANVSNAQGLLGLTGAVAAGAITTATRRGRAWGQIIGA